jgi:phytoene synthase
MPTELELAYDHCQRVAREHARNFYYAFRTLPPTKRRAIYAAYAFCRLCDDIADEDLPNGEKERRFAHARQLLLGVQGTGYGIQGEGNIPNPEARTQKPVPCTPYPVPLLVFAALQDASRAFNIPHRYFEEVIEGVEMDLKYTRFQTFEELRGYCYKVASVVGLICIEVFGYEDPRARDYAVDLGLAMQLTNIMRDVKEDYGRGRIYIPLDEMRSFGYSEAELKDEVVNDAFRRLMAFQAERARRYFASGKRLIPLLSRESRACPAMLHQVYSGVLDRIEASGYNVFERRIGLSAPEKLFLMAKLWAGSRMPAIPLLTR